MAIGFRRVDGELLLLASEMRGGAALVRVP